jgi:hypothetical protein
VQSPESTRLIGKSFIGRSNDQIRSLPDHCAPASAAERFFAVGGVYCVTEVTDRFGEYGLVGVMCVNGYPIEQFVMSWRAIGLLKSRTLPTRWLEEEKSRLVRR